jgi:hypothetical protein
MDKAVALANNDVVFIAWSYEDKIPDCLGFAIYRNGANGERTLLPAWIGFDGESNPDWKPKDTEVWPVQKFAWRDLTATWGQTYSYEVVPRVGEPGKLSSLDERKLVTNEVTLTPACSTNVSAYFNRGILSTQALSHLLPHDDKGVPSSAALLEHIKKAGDPIREALAGQIIEGLSLLLKATGKDGGHIHAAIYELNDPQLVELLKDPRHVSVVLSNAGSSDDPDATDRDARAALHEADVDITDRMMPSGHIGHNKFLVKLTPDGTPQAVLSGSTNWTSTGLCAQANNAILLSDASLAGAYLDFWERIKRECPPDSAQKATQGDDFRATNDAPHDFSIDGSDVRLWFSPNTKLHSKPSHDPLAPSDMAEVFDLIAAAKQGVFFLLFQPGSPCVLDAILDAQDANPELFVRGAATDAGAISNYETTLYHRSGEVAQVAAAAALDGPFGAMQQELLKSSNTAHAIIHDKIIVIDPRSSDCVVVTGSHNLGYRASYNNDENLLVIKGHQRLAEAYTTHVMDLYDHYRWRWRHKKDGASSGAAAHGGGLARDESWQSKYFSDAKLEAERGFWL